MDAAITVTSRRRARAWSLAAAVALLLVTALAQVQVVPPRVHVRWRDDVSAGRRADLERRYGLDAGERVEAGTWRYDVRDRSPGNIGALIADPAVADTAYVDRDKLTVPPRQVRVSWSRARALIGPAPAGLIQPQSIVLLVIAALLLWGARLPDARRRRAVALTGIAAFTLAAYALPLRQPIRMGDSNTYMHDRESFEMFSGVRQIRFEAHLSHAILGRLDRLFGRTASSPARALHTLAALATAWFVANLLIVGVVEGWSPEVVRYLAIVMIAPAALMFFGYLELGQLSLVPAAFPLLVRGLRDRSRYLEAGTALAGIGAALHGFGVLSLAGSALASVASGETLARRLDALIRIVVWGTACYLGWVALYLLALKLPLVPGHAEAIPLRPWFVTQVGDRINAAIFSARGIRDIVAESWVAGVPLIALKVPLWRTDRQLVTIAAAFTIPSILFLVAFWPVQGLAVEMDLVFAAFPAAYALAWVGAQDSRRALTAALLLGSAHLVFWRVVLDTAFVNSRVG